MISTSLKPGIADYRGRRVEVGGVAVGKAKGTPSHSDRMYGTIAQGEQKQE